MRGISDGFAICVKPKFDAGTAKVPSEKDSAAEKFKLPVADLLVVRQFGEPIFPSLVPVDGAIVAQHEASLTRIRKAAS